MSVRIDAHAVKRKRVAAVSMSITVSTRHERVHVPESACPGEVCPKLIKRARSQG